MKEPHRLAEIVSLIFKGIKGQVWERLFLAPMASKRHSEETLSSTRKDFTLRLGETIVDQKTRCGLSLILTTRRAVVTGPDQVSTQHIKLTGQVGRNGNHLDEDGKAVRDECCFFDRFGRTRRTLDFLHEDLAHYCSQWPDNTHEGSRYTPIETRHSMQATS